MIHHEARSIQVHPYLIVLFSCWASKSRFIYLLCGILRSSVVLTTVMRYFALSQTLDELQRLTGCKGLGLGRLTQIYGNLQFIKGLHLRYIDAYLFL